MKLIFSKKKVQGCPTSKSRLKFAFQALGFNDMNTSEDNPQCRAVEGSYNHGISSSHPPAKQRAPCAQVELPDCGGRLPCSCVSSDRRLDGFSMLIRIFYSGKPTAWNSTPKIPMVYLFSIQKPSMAKLRCSRSSAQLRQPQTTSS